MAPQDDAASLKDCEASAKQELRAIHPNVKLEISRHLGAEVWRSMSFTEKLAAIKENQSVREEAESGLQQWEKDLCKRQALAGPPPTREEREIKKAEEAKAAGPRYWVPPGRCPYGLDRGQWVISKEELLQHNSEHSCWISIHGHVFDLTQCLGQLPGTYTAKILAVAGADASGVCEEVFDTPQPQELLRDCRIGWLDTLEEGAKTDENGEVCPISGKTGTCPMQAMLGGDSSLKKTPQKGKTSKTNQQTDEASVPHATAEAKQLEKEGMIVDFDGEKHPKDECVIA